MRVPRPDGKEQSLAAELLVAEDGTTVYDFNVLTPKEKERARNIG